MIPETLALAPHDAPLFRATAAWLMGETGDPRFTDTIMLLLRESNALVRKRAFAAQDSRGGRTCPRQPDVPPLCPAGRSDSAKRRILLGLGPGAALLPTQIFVTEDGEPIHPYRVVERTTSAKRPRRQWMCLCAFNPTRKRSTSRPPPGCLDVWHSLALAVGPESGFAGKRHVILFRDASDRPAPGDQFRASIIAAHALLQVISTGPDPVVEEFCRAVGGVFRLNSPDALAQTCLTLLGRYEICYQSPTPEARSATIHVHAPGMSAATSVALSASPSPTGS